MGRTRLTSACCMPARALAGEGASQHFPLQTDCPVPAQQQCRVQRARRVLAAYIGGICACAVVDDGTACMPNQIRIASTLHRCWSSVSSLTKSGNCSRADLQTWPAVGSPIRRLRPRFYCLSTGKPTLAPADPPLACPKPRARCHVPKRGQRHGRTSAADLVAARLPVVQQPTPGARAAAVVGHALVGRAAGAVLAPRLARGACIGDTLGWQLCGFIIPTFPNFPKSGFSAARVSCGEHHHPRPARCRASLQRSKPRQLVRERCTKTQRRGPLHEA